MGALKRTTIYLTDELMKKLKILAAVEGKGLSEIMREALEDYVARKGRTIDVSGLLKPSKKKPR